MMCRARVQKVSPLGEDLKINSSNASSCSQAYQIVMQRLQLCRSTSSWTATRVSPDDDGLAPDTREGPAGECVYDIYALREGQGTSDSLWDTAPEVQVTAPCLVCCAF